MKVTLSWVWLAVISVANITLAGYYGLEQSYALSLIYGGFGGFWVVLTVSAFKKANKKNTNN